MTGRPTPQRTAVLFELKVDIGREAPGQKISVREGDDLDALARAFATLHGLPASAIPRLVTLLSQNLEMHLTQQGVASKVAHAKFSGMQRMPVSQHRTLAGRQFR